MNNHDSTRIVSVSKYFTLINDRLHRLTAIPNPQMPHRTNMLISRPLKRLTPLLACLLLCSCFQQDEEIRQYRVAKDFQSTSAPVSGGGDQVWFFKLMAPTGEFEKTSSEFAQIFIGVDVSTGVPKINLPKNWTSSDGPAPIYQTLKIANAKKTSVTVTPLPAPSSDPVQYLKLNIDRWRQQIGLPPLTSEDWLSEAMEKSEIVSMPKGNQFLSLVHLTGTTEDLGETHMLVGIISQQSLTGKAAMAAAPAATPGPSSDQVKYDLPEGWQEAQGNGISLVALTAPHEAGDANFTITRLGGGGDVLPNINRWRGQVKLDPITEAELKEQVEEVEVDGIAGQLSVIEGPEDSILAVILQQDDAKWFFKLHGPTPTVKAEQERFREFLKSVKLNIESE